MRQIAAHGEGDERIVMLAIPTQHGEIRVLDTNADPIWEEQDQEVFDETWNGPEVETEWIVSAPAQSGFEKTVETEQAAWDLAAKLVGVATDDMETRESPDGATTYCYASEADAEADTDGAYEVQFRKAGIAR